MAKKRTPGRSHLDKESLKKLKSTLPEANQVEDQLKQMIGQKSGRPLKTAAVGRRKFTTQLQPKLIADLKKAAIDKEITAADLLEQILKDYFK